MRNVVGAGLIALAAVVAVAAYNIVRSQVLHGPVNGRSLYVSVEDEAGAGNVLLEDENEHPKCRHTRGSPEWSCVYPLAGGSTGTTYTVRVHPDDSCWEAERDRASELPEHISGCVHLSE
jgi:hypothetical protein